MSSDDPYRVSPADSHHESTVYGGHEPSRTSGGDRDDASPYGTGSARELGPDETGGGGRVPAPLGTEAGDGATGGTMPPPGPAGYAPPGYGAAPEHPAYAPSDGGHGPYGQPGYGQAPYGQEPYGQAPYPGGYGPGGYGYVPPPAFPGTDGLSIAAMVCGIAGVTLVPLLPSFVAVVLGIMGLRNVKHSGQEGRGMAIAGLVLGGAGVLLWIVVAVLVVGAFVVVGSSTPSGLPTI